MSAILSEADLNDFIGPGLACIKPAGEVRLASSTDSDSKNARIEIQIDSNGDATEISMDDGSVQNLPSASISLQDCLACSGCITSAEEILLSKQTHKILLDDLNQFKEEKIFCMSISHQSRVSISDVLDIPIYKVDEFLINLFSERYGFKYIVGTELGRVLSIARINSEIISQKDNKPRLSSVCPGFVLYVEKTKPEVLPYLLNVKSPQQLTGNLLKTLISKQSNITQSDVYHLSIMPCFDKKLEAARSEDDFVDVDCVLTPKEIIELIKEENINIFEYLTKSSIPPTDLYQRAAPQHWPFPKESWDSNIGSTSGGYAYNYILSLQSQHEGSIIKEINGKNSDVLEYQLISKEGEKLASSAIVNGFRNIQNLVRKLKPSGKVKLGSAGLQARRKARLNSKKPDATSTVGDTADPHNCDFVEVMACPGGCINGGGINQVDNPINNKDHLNKLVEKYQTEFKEIENLKDVGFLQQFVQEFQSTFQIKDERLFKYKFNPVEKATDILTVGSKW